MIAPWPLLPPPRRAPMIHFLPHINSQHILVLTPPVCSEMISQLLVILGFSTLSALAWGSNTSVHGQFALGGAPWCTGLGDSTIDTLASFRLYAWYKDLPNSNSAGVPLVLATTGATAGTYSHTLAVSLAHL